MTLDYRRSVCVACVLSLLSSNALAAGSTTEFRPPKIDWSRAVKESVEATRTELMLAQSARGTSGTSRRKKVLIAAAVGLGFGLYTGYRISADSGSSRAATMVAVGAGFTALGLAVGFAMPEARPHPGTWISQESSLR